MKDHNNHIEKQTDLQKAVRGKINEAKEEAAAQIKEIEDIFRGLDKNIKITWESDSDLNYLKYDESASG